MEMLAPYGIVCAFRGIQGCREAYNSIVNGGAGHTDATM